MSCGTQKTSRTRWARKGAGLPAYISDGLPVRSSIANSEPKRSKLVLDGRTVFFHEYLHHLMLQDTSVAYPNG